MLQTGLTKGAICLDWTVLCRRFGHTKGTVCCVWSVLTVLCKSGDRHGQSSMAGYTVWGRKDRTPLPSRVDVTADNEVRVPVQGQGTVCVFSCQLLS